MLLLFHRTPINIPSCFCQIGDTDEPWESTPGKELLLAIGKESRLDLAERNRRRERKRMRKEWRGWFSFSRSWRSCWGANSSCKTTGMKTGCIGFSCSFRFCVGAGEKQTRRYDEMNNIGHMIQMTFCHLYHLADGHTVTPNLRMFQSSALAKLRTWGSQAMAKTLLEFLV